MFSRKILLIIITMLMGFPCSVLSMKIDYVEEENVQTPLIPKHFSDELLYSTLRIEVNKTNGKNEIGTGLIYLFDTNQKDQQLPFLVTNKHVFKDAVELKFRLHEREANSVVLKKISKKLLYVTLSNIQSEDGVWHSQEDIDLFALFLGPIFNVLNEKLKPHNRIIYYSSLCKSDLVNPSPLSAIEDILMVGYPIGLSDTVNHFPIFRKGITTSHPSVDYNGKPEFLIDSACFPGSSGSPVFLYNPLSSTQIGRGRLALLGILYAGPHMALEGNIVKKDIPGNSESMLDHSSQTNIPIKLGYVIKANQLEDIEVIIKKNPKFTQ